MTKPKGTPKERPQPDTVIPKKVRSFPIVGVGASAGGLDAFEKFFSAMPAETESGMAIVLIQHLDPGHKSILTELIRRYTRKTVRELKNGMAVEPNQVYIIPPNRDLCLQNGTFQLIEPAASRGLHLTIDIFFRSLAIDQGERAICIILSGTGTDGTVGLRVVKEAGGMAMVQDPATAEFDGMPKSAIATGLADFILPPEKMAACLIDYVQRVRVSGSAAASRVSDIGLWLPKIFALLRSQTGHDFTFYKHSTIRRRIERRMVVNQIDHIEEYLRYLDQNSLERTALFNDLLIGVTSFFRDAESFAALETKILPRLFEDHRDGTPIRVWVAGCSTGEEAYSLAILFKEYAEGIGRKNGIQFFATDIDRRAIEQARSAVYPDSISVDVAPERLARFFQREETGSYRVKKSLRDILVFSEQDVIKDPPFSRMDLIACRNLLIYLGPELQKKVIPLFHYALRPGGVLILGGSESIGEFTSLFESLDRKWKIYRRREVLTPRPLLSESIGRERSYPPGGFALPDGEPKKNPDIRAATEQIVLRDYTPACVTVNARGEILYVHGRAGQYLELVPGEINVNVARIAREGLRLELSTGLRKAVAGGETVRYKNLPVRMNGDIRTVHLTIRPLGPASTAPGLLLIVFEEAPEPAAFPAQAGRDPEAVDPRVALLENELKTKEEHLQSAVEELETANEELNSTNEELQSTNEELETSKEELQSLNEELTTVNTELREKIDDLTRVNNDMNNLLSGTGIATIFVDLKLAIMRFTPSAAEIVNLIPADLGRAVAHIASNLAGYDRLVEDIQKTLDDLVPREIEVRTQKGRWFTMRIQPYRTRDNVIEGAVVTFTDITECKKAEAQTVFQAGLMSGIHEAFIGTDETSRVTFWNKGAEDMFGWTAEEVLGRETGPLLEARIDGSDRGEVLRLLKTAGHYESLVRFKRKDGGHFTADVRAAVLKGPAGKITGAMAAIRDCGQAPAPPAGEKP
jgi:two-component system CheB/CheR fusion protein